jgi:thiol-disulfide isomerase/thioredoxin
MEGVLQLGPLMIATDRLIAVALLWAFLSAGAFIAARTESRAGRVAWIAAAVGIVAARIGYVAENAAAFMVEPWTVLALWQGGFSLWPGVLATAVAIVMLLGRQRATAGLVASLAVLVSAQIAATALLAPQPRPLPSGPILADMAQRPIPIESLRGQPFVVNLWATWCPPCRREMPMMIDVAAGSDIPILLVNQGEDVSRVRDYLAREGLADTSIRLDPLGALGEAIGTRAMPTTLFIDADGRIRRTHTGEISRAALLAALRDLERITS